MCPNGRGVLDCLSSVLVHSGQTTVSDSWPVQRRTYSYLPSLYQYQFILLGDRGTYV